MSATLNIGERKAANGERQASTLPAAHRSSLTAHAAAARRRAWLAFVGLTAMFIVAALWRPADEPAVVLCPFRALTHYPCPGCGMTRAFCALAHGEFWRAVRFNALSPLLFLSAMVAWAWAAATVFGFERVRLALARLPRPSPAIVRLMLALVIVWWAARLAVGF